MARLAKSLNTLRAEANTTAPGRSKASDGWIGDPAHASRPSRHNPNKQDVVCAWDGTNDPAAGFPVHTIMRWLAANILRPLYLRGIRQADAPEPWNNVAYFITADETFGWSTGWLPKPYRGANRHLKHGHAAVGVGPDAEPRAPYDSTVPWGIARACAPHPTPAPLPDPEELTMADISQILAKLEALEAQANAQTQTIMRLTASGGGGSTFDFDGDGEDTNYLRLDVIVLPTPEDPVGEAAVVQRVFTQGAWSDDILARGYIPGSASGLMPRGRRFDFSAQRLDLTVDSYTWDPDSPGPLPRGWSVTNLPAIDGAGG